LIALSTAKILMQLSKVGKILLNHALATAQLETITFDPTYAHLFFTYISNSEIAPENRLQAALFFKNAVSKYWNPDESDPVAQEKAFGAETKKYVKDNFAKLLMLNPKKIGENLVDIANVVGKTELNVEWPQFLPVFRPFKFTRNCFKVYRLHLRIHTSSSCKHSRNSSKSKASYY
jgi:hypothetical protein